MIRPDFISDRGVITAANIEKYLRLKHYRPIRQSHVMELYRVLESGKPFEGAIAINKDTKTGVLTVIDGSHRLFAIEKMIKLNPDFKMEVARDLYLDKSEDEIFNIYMARNRNISEDSGDMLEVMQDKLPLIQYLLKRIPYPVSVSSKNRPKDGFALQTLLSNYFLTFKKRVIRRDEIIEEVRRVDTENEMAKIEYFITNYLKSLVSVIGLPNKANKGYYNIGMTRRLMSIYKIALDNGLLPSEFTSRLESAYKLPDFRDFMIRCSSTTYLNFSTSGSESVMVIINYLNKHRKIKIPYPNTENEENQILN
jgi:hypothetical protein